MQLQQVFLFQWKVEVYTPYITYMYVDEIASNRYFKGGHT